jgi:hypothetical protein
MGILAANFIGLCWLGLCSTSWAVPDWGAVSGDLEASWAYAEQEVFPEIEARKRRATLQIKARKGYFENTLDLDASFPELVALDLSDAEVVRGRLLLLNELGEARARERLHPVPPLGSAERHDTLREAFEGALRLEAQVDSLERRYLVALRVLYEMHPLTQRASLDGVLGHWRPIPPRPAATESERDAYAMALFRFAEEEGRLNQLLSRIHRQATVPGQGAVDLSPDFQRIGDPATAGPAIDRLLIGRAFQVPGAAEIIDDVSLTWFRGPALEVAVARGETVRDRTAAALPPSEDEEALVAGSTEAEKARDAVQAALDQLQPDLSEVGEARRAVLIVSLASAKARLGVWQRALAELRGETSVALDVTAEASRAQLQAEEAKLRADQARQQGKDARSQRILDGLASSRARRQATWATITTFRDQAAASAGARADALRDSEEVLRHYQSRSLILSDRSEVDAAYQSLRGTTANLRADIRQVLAALIQASDAEDEALSRVDQEHSLIDLERRAVASVVDDAERVDLEKALKSWDAALVSESEAAAERMSGVRAARDDAFVQLRHARDLRRALEPMLSSEAALRDRRYLLRDIGNETSLLKPQLLATQRANFRALASLPGDLLDLNFLSRTLFRGFSVIAMFLLWWFGRGFCVPAVKNILIQARKSGFDLRPVDIHALSEPGVRLSVAAVDLLAGFVLMRVLAADFPTLGLFILAYLQVALFRLIIATFDLVAVPHPQTRPALRVFLPAVYDLSRRSLRYAMMWLIGRRFIDYLLETVLHLDAIAVVVGWALAAVGMALVLWLLHSWEPVLRARLNRLNRSNWLVLQLSREPASSALRAPHALVGLGLLCLSLAWDLLHRLASERRELGRLMNVVSRYQLGVHDVDELPPPLSHRPWQLPFAGRTGAMPSIYLVKRRIVVSTLRWRPGNGRDGEGWWRSWVTVGTASEPPCCASPNGLRRTASM